MNEELHRKYSINEYILKLDSMCRETKIQNIDKMIENT